MLAAKVFPFTLYNTTWVHFAKQDGNFPQEKILPCPSPVHPRAVQKQCTIHNAKRTIHTVL